MKPAIPIKKLMNLTWVLALVIGIFEFLYLALALDLIRAFFYTGIGVFMLLLIGWMNSYIFILLSQKFVVQSKKFKQYRYAYSYPSSLLIHLLLHYLLNNVRNGGIPLYDPQVLLTFFVSAIFVNTLIIMVQNYVVLEHDKLKTNLELSALKVAHAEAENLLLRQQVHPHFLFNALGTLKALYKQNPKAGDTYVIHLANFLRASVSNHTNKIARLDEELTLLQDYLEMQKIRFGTALVCTIHVPKESLKTYWLPAFSLQPLLENAIKHNELTEEMPLQVVVSQQGDRMVISNNLQRKRTKEPSTGNGLSNLTERYRLLSGDAVIIEEREGVFSVSLKMFTNEYSHNRR